MLQLNHQIVLCDGMIDRQLEQIGTNDLHALVSHGRTEGRTLDFKLTFPGSGERAVKDFLADVTALANTDGGDIVIGIREDGNGAAAEIVGIPDHALDADLLRIEAQLRDCVDPRVPGFRVQTVRLPNGGAVLVLRVRASSTAPHRVTYSKSSRFYARNSRGNYEMSTEEIRHAFAASDEMPRKIRDLHHRAVTATSGKDMPCRLADTPAVVLTVAPLSVLREPRDIRITREAAVLPPRVSGGIEMVIGLDGLIVHSPIDDQSRSVRTFSINHRKGYVDCAWAIGRKLDDGRKIIWRKYVEDEIIGAARSAVSRLRTYGIEGPWVAMATMLGIKDYGVILGDNYVTNAAWQDPAYLGEVVDDTLDPDSLKPFIEGFWRLFGIDQAPATCS